MKKSDILGNKMNQAEIFIEKARDLVNTVFQEDEFGNYGEMDAGKFNKELDNIIEQIGVIAYDIIAPIQMEEDEREEEIRVLERRLAALKSMQ